MKETSVFEYSQAELRLECLRLAIELSVNGDPARMVVERARTFASYVCDASPWPLAGDVARDVVNEAAARRDGHNTTNAPHTGLGLHASGPQKA